MSSLAAKARFARLGGVSGTQNIPQVSTTSGAPNLPPTIQDATTARTAAVADNNVIVEFTNNSDIAYTIKASASVPLPVGAILYAKQGGDGQVTFVADAGVTFDDTSDSYSTRTKNAYIAMKHTATDRWSPMGDLEWLVDACAIVGNPSNADAPPTSIAATADDQRLVRRSGVLVWEGEFAVAGGTADALTGTVSTSDVFTLSDGMLIGVRAASANATTTPTLALNGGTARTITKNGNQALVAGDIKGAGHELLLRYVAAGPRYELLNPAVSGGGSSVTISDTPPASPSDGDEWVDAVEGVRYTYYDDGNTSQWVEFGSDTPRYLFNPPAQGATFPASPADGDRFYRTDKNMDCFYKASIAAWLTVHEYEHTLVTLNAGTPFLSSGSSGNVFGRSGARRDMGGMYLTRLSMHLRTQATNNGSNYWRWQVNMHNSALNNVLMLISAESTAADAAGTYVDHSIDINAAAPSTAYGFYVIPTAVGAPGSCHALISVFYRMIVT